MVLSAEAVGWPSPHVLLADAEVMFGVKVGRILPTDAVNPHHLNEFSGVPSCGVGSRDLLAAAQGEHSLKPQVARAGLRE